ncbi:MAG: sigma-54-dependent Fis family transcriptional regulator [Bdellovibrionales bacterium]|nr:sigma-54-dependent Fis family transcriptional regulator [Bdellovibrionales bacterium]
MSVLAFDKEQSEKSRQIVVVDNDLEVLDVVSAYFKPRGYSVIGFNDAAAAIKESTRTGKNWDVLITDLKFPTMSGIEFTVQIKKYLPSLPVILMTQPCSTETAVEAIKSGAYDFLVKPVNFGQLQVAVDRAIHLQSLNGDISHLREIIKSSSSEQGRMIGRSPAFLSAVDIARRVAKSSANILITGESGSGKEVFAKFIHRESGRKAGPFVAINCSAIPENLLESELFGHAKGAFTGAQEKRIGLFEEAQDGTLFLDEIGDLTMALQAKILRVLQEKVIRRVGENQNRTINCRIISATHKDLAAEVSAGRFREDLFFRLDVIPILIPPLRDRPEDLLLLAESFLRKFAVANGSPAKTFSKAAVQYLLVNQWRGNVRELENTIERAVVLCGRAEISVDDFLPMATGLESNEASERESESDGLEKSAFCVRFSERLPTLDEVIRQYIAFAVANKNGARDKTAKEIGIDRKTLYKRLRTIPDLTV